MILHIMISEKFMAPFIDFVDMKFGRGEHKYVFITNEKYQFGLRFEHDVQFLCTDDDIFNTLHKYMTLARKIIIHGLWRDKVDQLLLKEPDFLSKSYWFMWGGDFYFPERQTINRALVIKNIKNLVSGLSGDVEYVRQHYSAVGRHHSCFLYPSNIFNSFPNNPISEGKINILVGNSASPENNHLKTFEILKKYKHEDIKIFVPLSYGDGQYRDYVIKLGESIFEEKFISLTSMLSVSDYLNFLASIDVALFNHNRQQAMGNIINLLGLGKLVYMRRDVSTWNDLKHLGVKVYDIDDFDLYNIDSSSSNENFLKIKAYFSESNLAESLSVIFDYVD